MTTVIWLRSTAAVVAAVLGAATLPAAAAVSSQDAAFMTAAARGGMAEVAQATIALGKGSSAPAKTFAKTMLHDHGAANKKLAALAQSKGVQLPSDMRSADVKMKGTLEGLSGRTFDTAYLHGQRQAHIETQALFRQEIATGSDPDVVAFAKQVLPTVQDHIILDLNALKELGSSPAPRTPGQAGTTRSSH